MLVPILAFVTALALALGASRLRSVAGLAGLVAVAHAGGTGDPRSAVLTIVLPAGLALITADALRLRARRAVTAAASRRAADGRRERRAGEPAR